MLGGAVTQWSQHRLEGRPWSPRSNISHAGRHRRARTLAAESADPQPFVHGKQQSATKFASRRRSS
jgi:hypothetical protein